MRPVFALPLLAACTAAPRVPIVEVALPPQQPAQPVQPAQPAPEAPSLLPSSCLRRSTRFASGHWMADEFATDADGRLVAHATAYRGSSAKTSVERQTLRWSRAG